MKAVVPMETNTLKQILATRNGTLSDIVQLYDQLDTVSVPFMLGQWRGYEIATGHYLEGLLVPSGWYGKCFSTPEEVYPLLFFSKQGKELYAVNPKNLPLGLTITYHWPVALSMTILRPFLQTNNSSARLRMVQYRGRTTGTMVYDDKPINDHFVKIDDKTVLGLMDRKGDDSPYAFILERNSSPVYSNR